MTRQKIFPLSPKVGKGVVTIALIAIISGQRMAIMLTLIPAKIVTRDSFKHLNET
jgi:hypothetical protein